MFAGWLFDWTRPVKNGYSVHALLAEGDCRIQGAIAVKVCQGYVEIDIAEAAPWNNKKNNLFKGEKDYEGIGPHLFAFACKLSMEMVAMASSPLSQKPI